MDMRASGIDPSQTGEAAEKRRTSMKQRRREEAEWDAEHPDMEGERAAYVREILPTLQQLSLSTIASATGLSQQYCSLIRRGLRVPHPRHWQTLAHIRGEDRGS